MYGSKIIYFFPVYLTGGSSFLTELFPFIICPFHTYFHSKGTARLLVGVIKILLTFSRLNVRASIQKHRLQNKKFRHLSMIQQSFEVIFKMCRKHPLSFLIVQFL